MCLTLIARERLQHGGARACAHRELAHEAGRQSKTWLKLGVPALAARVMAGEMAEELLLSGQRVVPAKLLEDGFRFHYPNLKEALADLMPDKR
jgi:NAD dependent epimerase/dehydratase family enzyme